jgi:hypothetical protein
MLLRGLHGEFKGPKGPLAKAATCSFALQQPVLTLHHVDTK